MAADLVAAGLADQAQRYSQSGSFVLYPENRLTVRAFLELEHGWLKCFAADGSPRIALNPANIKHTLELMGVKRRAWPAIFNGLTVMEAEAVKQLFGELSE